MSSEFIIVAGNRTGGYWAKMFPSIAFLLACVAATVQATPLDDYVNMPDSHYKYEVLDEYRMDGQYIAYVLNMTSQKWLTCKFFKYFHILHRFTPRTKIKILFFCTNIINVHESLGYLMIMLWSLLP